MAAAALLPEHLRELVAGSGIAPLVAQLNCRSFGPGAAEHWETARAELIAHKRLAIQTTSTTEGGLPQARLLYTSDAAADSKGVTYVWHRIVKKQRG